MIAEDAIFTDAQLQMNISTQQALALFFLGSKHSGASFHSHTNAWNALVHGERQWYLYPPYKFTGPYSLPWAQFSRHPNALKAYKCIQRSQEIVYVPNQWFHGVENLRASVGIAVEFGPWEGLLQEHLQRYA